MRTYDKEGLFSLIAFGFSKELYELQAAITGGATCNPI